jgi:hypothetical protein
VIVDSRKWRSREVDLEYPSVSDETLNPTSSIADFLIEGIASVELLRVSESKAREG